MLMLAESLQIRVVEVPTGWKRGKQHELIAICDTLGMASALAVPSAAWASGARRILI